MILDMINSYRDENGWIKDIKGATDFISGFVSGSYDQMASQDGEDWPKTDVNIVIA
jgi:hypothetical protein